jgi:hypothetical protein
MARRWIRRHGGPGILGRFPPGSLCGVGSATMVVVGARRAVSTPRATLSKRQIRLNKYGLSNGPRAGKGPRRVDVSDTYYT